MYTLLAGSPPFWHRKQMLMLRMILAGTYDFSSPEWEDRSDTVKDLVSPPFCGVCARRSRDSNPLCVYPPPTTTTTDLPDAGGGPAEEVHGYGRPQPLLLFPVRRGRGARVQPVQTFQGEEKKGRGLAPGQERFGILDLPP